MGVDSVGGSSSSRSSSTSGSNNTSKTTSDSAKTADTSKATEQKAAEAADAEKAAIAAKTNFNVSTFTPAEQPNGMPALTAPTFTKDLLDPTSVAMKPELTAPQITQDMLQAATLGPLGSFEKPAPIPMERPEAAPSAANLTYGPDANPAAVSAHSQAVLKEIMDTAGVTSARINSTARTPEAQARAMYDNIQSQGVASQKALYSKYGDQVIDAYSDAVNAGLNKDQTIQAMVDKINELGPSNVSRHLADPSQLNVVDIAPSSIPADKREAFQEAIRANPGVSKFLGPSNGDPAYHIEIPQPQ